MDDPVVFARGEYERSGDGWKAVVTVPEDVRLSQITASSGEETGGLDAETKSGAE